MLLPPPDLTTTMEFYLGINRQNIHNPNKMLLLGFFFLFQGRVIGSNAVWLLVFAYFSVHVMVNKS